MTANSKVDIKIVLLGAAAAGKTTLVERYLNKRFVDNPQATIGAAFNAKKVKINDESVVLGIWDTAGSERYEAMSRIYYRSAKAAIICFDLKSADDFAKVKEWVAELKEQEPGCVLYIVGCKLDTIDPSTEHSRVDPAAVRTYAQKVDAHVFETSAKTGFNVDELFFTVAENWLKAERRARNIHGATNSDSSNVDLNGRPVHPNGGSSCPC